jgi:hypothetical protein
MWDVVGVDGWEIRVRSVERVQGPLPGTDRGDVTRAAGQFVLVAVDLANRSAAPLRPRAEDFALRAASGSTFTNVSAAPFVASYAAREGSTPFGSAVAPGDQIDTLLVFDIDPRASLLTLSVGGRQRLIRLDECHCGLPLPSENRPWEEPGS